MTDILNEMELRETIRKQQQEIIRLGSEILRLRRGEFICKKCGLRKNAEKELVCDF